MMRTIKLFFCFFLMISGSVYAQNADFSEEVSTYLDHNGTMQQYEYAYEELLKMLEKQYPKSEKTAKAWAYLEKKNKTISLGAIKKDLIPVYEEHFEPSEVSEMNTFYQSDTAKQLMNDRSQMTAAQKEELNDFYTSATGQKIISKQEILTQAIASISENWSRDLYETAVSLLKE